MRSVESWKFESVTAIEAAGSQCQDVVLTRCCDQSHLLVLADGAGGMSGGRLAAELTANVLAEVDLDCQEAQSADTWEQRLLTVDRILLEDASAGESTGLVVHYKDGLLHGASVGDSEAWMFSSEAMVELSIDQTRKPLLGSGRALPQGFKMPFQGDRILVASDGLFKYAETADLWIDSLESSLTDACERMIRRVRLKSGGLRDDVSIGLLRKTS